MDLHAPAMDTYEPELSKTKLAFTPTQYRLLSLLICGAGRVFSSGELVEQAIGDVVSERTVDQHIKELRRKLGPHGQRIETVRGIGYRYREDFKDSFES